MEKPQTEGELTRQLADTIGAQVLNLLEGSGFNESQNYMIDAQIAAAGQPGSGGGSTQEQPPVADNPPVTAPAPKATTTPQAPATPNESGIDWESFKEPNGKYLGKYDDLPQLVKGVRNAVQMAKQAFTERDTAVREAAELRQRLLAPAPALTPGAAPQPTTSTGPTRGTEGSNARLDSVLSKLQNDGVLDAENLTELVSAIREQARQDTVQIVKEETSAQQAAAKAEKTRWDKVDQYMSENYPDSMAHTDEIGLFIQANPKIGRAVTALISQDLHEDAMEMAWNAYSKTLGGGTGQPPATKENIEKEIKLDAADQVRREAVEQARKDAGIISGGAAGGVHGVHENVDAGPTQEEMANAMNLMRQGYGEQWRKLTFGPMLKHPIFGD